MSEVERAPLPEPHPIVAQMAPSDEQLPAIVERGRDVIVTAGAGTGKTRTLVARYLSLLAEGIPLRGIVAITFTKKAAREMRNRVREEMRRYLERSDLDPDERRRWQGFYSKLDAARIGTIHSFCTEILRAHPAEARVDPRFEVLDEGQTNILRGQAVDEALAWAADDREAVSLFALLGEYGLRPLLDQLLQKRLAVSDTYSSLPPDLLSHWERILREQQEGRLIVLLASPEWNEAVATLEASRAREPDDRMELQRQEALGAIQAPAGSLGDRLASLVHLGRINLQGGRQGAWPGGKPQLDEVKAALRALRRLWQGHGGLLELSLNPQDGVLAQVIPVLEAAFAFACQRYDAAKRELNVLDFDDLERGALALLQVDAGVRGRWQEEVRSILVDEFQDTNGRQRDLVRLLNGERGRLFIVGDAKQSIYRFRDADVTVFRMERERIEGAGGAVFWLDTSYRAHRELIQGLNDLLRPVLGEDEDPARPWVEPFAALRHQRERTGPGFEAPHIELHLTVGTKREGALERAAGALAERIVELVKGGAQVLDNDGVRPLDYGDIAVLCRASSSFGGYEDALERAGVPFLTVAGRGFYGRPEIRDLLNALQAIADPTDDLALVGLLRSPAFALSDAALNALCEGHRQVEGRGPLWDYLQGQGTRLSGEDGRKAERAARMVADLHKLVGRTPAADVLKAFLDATDYRAALIQAGQTRGARNVAKLLADAQASGIVGIGEFLEYIKSLRDTGTREGEARATAEGAVQIMSVHAAKGLEFPVVAIGDVTYQGRGRNSTLVEPGLGVLLPLKDDQDNLPAVYCLGKARSDDQEAAELDRLLYVAATRAREKLILSGCISLSQGGTPSRLGEWLSRIGEGDCLGLANTPISYDENGRGTVQVALQVGQTPVSCTIYEPGCTWRRQPHRIEPVDEAPVSLPPPLLSPVSPGRERVDRRTVDQDRSPPLRVWRVVPTAMRPTAPAWVIGSLVHQALAAWFFPDDGFERWAMARARGYGLTDPRQLADAVRQSQRLLARFQSHPLFREMNTAERRLHEVPYSLVVDGQVESGIIDAVYLRDGSWTIVEFKTDEVRTRVAFDQLLAKEDYLEQAQRYLSAAGRLLGQQPRLILCMLNYAGVVYLHPVQAGAA
jgi:ATP-dependent helicase/nuclease subunit A